MIFRENTQDLMAVCEVIWQNQYRLPPDMSRRRVIDIGAHIGSFAIACLKRKAERVVCVEPDPDNFALLVRNLAPYGNRATAIHGGVWAEGTGYTTLRLHARGSDYNTACSSVNPPEPFEPSTPAITLDELSEQAQCWDLLKLDCEGAEYPIFHTSRSLPRFREIVGELHPVEHNAPATSNNDFTIDRLVAILRSYGFSVETRPENEWPVCNTLFHARRCGAPP